MSKQRPHAITGAARRYRYWHFESAASIVKRTGRKTRLTPGVQQRTVDPVRTGVFDYDIKILGVMMVMLPGGRLRFVNVAVSCAAFHAQEEIFISGGDAGRRGVSSSPLMLESDSPARPSFRLPLNSFLFMLFRNYRICDNRGNQAE